MADHAATSPGWSSERKIRASSIQCSVALGIIAASCSASRRGNSRFPRDQAMPRRPRERAEPAQPTRESSGRQGLPRELARTVHSAIAALRGRTGIRYCSARYSDGRRDARRGSILVRDGQTKSRWIARTTQIADLTGLRLIGARIRQALRAILWLRDMARSSRACSSYCARHFGDGPGFESCVHNPPQRLTCRGQSYLSACHP